jgi:hypothetical protein
MKRFTLCLALASLLYASCSQDNGTGYHEEIAVDTTTISTDFVKTFEGKLNGKYEVVMKITSNGGSLSGHYFYKSKGGNIELKGSLNDESISLEEFDAKGNQTGTFTGAVEGNTIKGTWSKPNGSSQMPFVLSESKESYEVLQAIASGSSYEHISGEYSLLEGGDSYSGSLNINYKGSKKFKFQLVVGTSRGCTGDVEGTATFKSQNVATYSSSNCEGLTFTFSGNKVTVSENNCQYWHGTSCSFDGEFGKAQ